jgi:lipopolysaccharide transport system permease protein
MLGIWWSLITPLAMLFVFTFVFGKIFQARWHGGEENMVAFGLNLYAGLIVFWFFAELVSKAPTLISSQPNLVKKVVFPLEILSLVSLFSALFHFMINLCILCIAVLLYKGGLSWSILGVGVIILAFLPLLLGLSWMLSALGVYIKDIAGVIGIAMNMLMFLSPVFYPLEAVPQKFRWFFELNPITSIIEWVRASVMVGEFVSLGGVLIYGVVSLVVMYFGYRVFFALKGGFGDVL